MMTIASGGQVAKALGAVAESGDQIVIYTLVGRFADGVDVAREQVAKALGAVAEKGDQIVTQASIALLGSSSVVARIRGA